MAKKKEEYEVSPLCDICKYECKMPVFANIVNCKGMYDDKEVADKAKELMKEYNKRRNKK